MAASQLRSKLFQKSCAVAEATSKQSATVRKGLDINMPFIRIYMYLLIDVVLFLTRWVILFGCLVCALSIITTNTITFLNEASFIFCFTDIILTWAR